MAPIVSASIGYWSVQLGLAGKAIAQTPWPTPIGIGAYVGSGGNIGAFVVALICALAAFVIWYPFIKMYDTKLYKEEMKFVSPYKRFEKLFRKFLFFANNFSKRGK